MNETKFTPAIERYISEIIDNEGFIEQHTYRRCISTNGGNYLGELFEVDIRGKTKNGIKETNLFIKKIVNIEDMTIMSLSDVHSREVLAYKEILDIYEELENEAYIPEADRFKHVKCYASNEEALIFDNMAKHGYKNLNRKEVMSVEYAKLALEQLAKFHALSFALKRRRPDYFEEKIKLFGCPFHVNDEWKQLTENEIALACRYLDDEPERKLRAATKTMLEDYMKFARDSTLVLCHGDYRVNNILHKEENGKITDLRPIDFQLIYNGHPLNDFFYFVFPATDQHFRKQHLQEIKDHYFHLLTNYLKYFDIDVEEVYPKHNFEGDFKKRLLYGLFATLMVTPFLFVKDDEVPDLQKPLSSLEFSLEDGADDRFRDIVKDFIDWGVL